jgi:hypothetical protein
MLLLWKSKSLSSSKEDDWFLMAYGAAKAKWTEVSQENNFFDVEGEELDTFSFSVNKRALSGVHYIEYVWEKSIEGKDYCIAVYFCPQEDSLFVLQEKNAFL